MMVVVVCQVMVATSKRKSQRVVWVGNLKVRGWCHACGWFDRWSRIERN